MSDSDTGHVFAFITCSRAKWEATVTELAAEEGRSVQDVRDAYADDTDYDPTTDVLRLEESMEEHGWVDRRQPTTLYDSRNDVRPVVDFDLSALTSFDTDARESAEQEIRDALAWLEGGYGDGEGGVFYAKDSHKPFDSPWCYSYAIHFVRKFYGARGWMEAPWHPSEDGGIEL